MSSAEGKKRLPGHMVPHSRQEMFWRSPSLHCARAVWYNVRVRLRSAGCPEPAGRIELAGSLTKADGRKRSPPGRSRKAEARTSRSRASRRQSVELGDPERTPMRTQQRIVAS